MEALTALGVASNIIQLVEFAGKLISESVEAYDSIDGVSQHNSDLENIASSLIGLHQQLAKDASRTSSAGLSVAETQLQHLVVESVQIAEKLIETVRSLKGSGKSKRWKSVRHAIASAWKQKDITALETKLKNIRQQLDTVLLICLRERLDSPAKPPTEPYQLIHRQSELSSLFLKEIRSQQKELLQTIRKYEVRPSESQFKQFSAQLEATAGLSIEGQFSKLILAHLEFAEIQDRYERICQAHRATFEWIFRDPDEPRGRWDDFPQWLRAKSDTGERNFYFITGKAGSGKSTLMKHIFDDDRTLQHLQAWASGNLLLTAGFFFWNSGTEAQMSSVGLLRTLLYQLLRKHPHLIRQVFEKRWEAYQTVRGGFHDWTWSDLKQAFKQLTQVEGIRIAVFIDGLDEFDGDHEELAGFLLRFAGPNVKVCAASRPWLVFEDAFEGKPNLLLEQLTRRDIRFYVQDAFTANRHFTKLRRVNKAQASELVEIVVNKASGVFLWVYLVVKSLLQGMANADRISDLKRRLDSLPADLEALFDKLLRSLEPFYFSHAAQLIRILTAAPVPPTPLEMAYADEEDLSAAMSAEVRPWTETEATEISESIRRRLNSRCKGLIGVSQYGNSQLERVEFLHRTVKDFVHRADIWDSIIEAMPEDFDPNLCWSNSILMEVKTSDPDTILPADLFRLIQWGIQHAEQSEYATREWQTNYLDELDRTIKKLVALSSSLQSWSVPEYFSTGTCFLDLVFQHGMVFYVQEKLQDALFPVTEEELDILLDTVAISESPGSAELVKAIMKRGGNSDRAGLSTATTLISQSADSIDECQKAPSKQNGSETRPEKRTSWWRDRQLTGQIATKIEGFWSL